MIDDKSSFLLSALVVWLMAMGVLAIVGGFLYSLRERRLTHAERMRALELGREWPDDAHTARIKAIYGGEASEKAAAAKPLASQCYSTTGLICCVGFVFAFMSGTIPMVSIGLAAAAGSIGVAGLICGTVLALKAKGETALAEPRFGPDAA